MAQGGPDRSAPTSVRPQPDALAPTVGLPTTSDTTYEREIAAIETDLLAEIERLKREFAERERALTAERDDARKRLQFATDTKAWRASVAYWQARKRGLPGALDLGRKLVAYLARVGYHLGIPYPVRRDLWYRRHTGKSYQRYYRTLAAAQASAPLDPSATPERVSKVAGPDVLYFPACSWAESAAQHRRLALLFAQSGRRCFWLSPRLTQAPAGEVGVALAAETGAAGVVELTLPGDASDVTSKTVFRATALRHAVGALTRYAFEHDLREVVCVAQHPGWAPLLEALHGSFGWKVVYDVVDAPTDTRAADARLEVALARSDLIVTDTPTTRDRLLAHGLQAPRIAVIGEDALALTSAVDGLYGKATIIVVTYRNLDKTRLTVKSVLEKTRYPNYEILLVDNGGEPGILSYAREMAERFPGVVRCIFNDENLGFAGGNNVGLRAAQGSAYIVLLNDDVLAPPGWLGGLLRYLDDARIGLVGPVTNSAGNEARIAVDYTDVAQVDDFARRYTYAHDGVHFDIPVLAMYCLAMRGETAATLGDLDERFRLGMFEDDDYAMRAQRAGLRVVCAEDVFVHHFGRSSFGKMSEEAHAKLFAANRALLEQKWGITWNPHKYREG